MYEYSVNVQVGPDGKVEITLPPGHPAGHMKVTVKTEDGAPRGSREALLKCFRSIDTVRGLDRDPDFDPAAWIEELRSEDEPRS